MRTLAFGWVSFGTSFSAALALSLGLAVGCGQSEGDGGAGNTAGSATAGSSSSGAGTAGKAGSSATAGSSSAGNSSAGSSSGGNAAGGESGGATTGGQPEPQAGAGNEGGNSAGLVDCDPKKVLCKRTPPECQAGEVPSVDGTCYGDCVKVAQCACSAADQCPQPNEYTCWAKQHCGPFVQ